jgi:hypothetical protein
MKPVRFLVFIFLALVLASCSLQQTWDILGKWQSVDGNDVLQFSQDGVMTLANENTTMQVKYKMVDPKHVQIYLGNLATLDMAVAISDGELTLTQADGTITKYKKAK